MIDKAIGNFSHLDITHIPDEHARVTLIVSSLTDDRQVVKWLEDHGWTYHREQWSMASSTDRDAFSTLQQTTGWKTLPMIFLDGKFIGGIDEFFSHRAVISAPGRDETSLQKWASVLGYAGLVPFALGALGALLMDELASARVQYALLAYAAVILSFIGALHWSNALIRDNSRAGELLVSVMPAILAWLALLMPVSLASPFILAGFVIIYLYDRKGWSHIGWFAKLRRNLTIGATLSIATGWLAGI